MIHFITNKPVKESKDYLIYFNNVQGFKKAIETWCLNKADSGFDTETNGLDAHVNKLLLISFGDVDNQFVIDTTSVDKEDVKTLLELILQAKRMILHNGKFDYKMVKTNLNIELHDVFDTMIADQCIYRGAGFSSDNLSGKKFNISDVTSRYVNNIEFHKEIRDEFVNKDPKSYAPQPHHITYSANDVKHLCTIKQKQTEILKRFHLLDYCVNIAFPLIPVVGDIELEGMTLDAAAWQAIIDENEEMSFNTQLQLDETVKSLRDTILSPSERLFLKWGKYDYKRQKSPKFNKMGLFGDEVSNKVAFGTDKLVFNKHCINWGSEDDIIEIFAKLKFALPVKDNRNVQYSVPRIVTTNTKEGMKMKVLKDEYKFTTAAPEFEQYLIDYPDSLAKPLIELLLQYRSAQHAITSFGANWFDKINPITGNIHTIFRTEGAITGRFQSGGGKREPNLPNFQNIPSDVRYRKAFTTNNQSLYNIVTCDLSGAEVTIMCDKAHDKQLYEWAVKNDDAHSPIATAVWRNIFLYRAGVLAGFWSKIKEFSQFHDNSAYHKALSITDKEDVRQMYALSQTFLINKKQNKSMRTAFKAVTFGTVYGMYAGKCAKTMNISKEEAEIVLWTIKKAIPATFEMVETNVARALNYGVLELNSRTHNRILFPEVIRAIKNGEELDFKVQSAVGGVARNSPIQGTQADMVKEGLVNIHNFIKANKLDARILNTVHDEVVVKFNTNITSLPVKNNLLLFPEVIKSIMTSTANLYLNHYEMGAEYDVSKTWTK